jgi:hypothetical protein
MLKPVEEDHAEDDETALREWMKGGAENVEELLAEMEEKLKNSKSKNNSLNEEHEAAESSPIDDSVLMHPSQRAIDIEQGQTSETQSENQA